MSVLNWKVKSVRVEKTVRDIGKGQKKSKDCRKDKQKKDGDKRKYRVDKSLVRQLPGH